MLNTPNYDDVIKWKHFPRYWHFVQGIHRFPMNSPHKGQWRGALIFSLICARINGLVNNREAGDLQHYSAHYDVIVMLILTVMATSPTLETYSAADIFTYISWREDFYRNLINFTTGFHMFMRWFFTKKVTNHYLDYDDPAVGHIHKRKWLWKNLF